MKKNQLRIEVVFIGKPQWEGGWPYVGYDNNELMKNLTEHLEIRFPQILFGLHDIITGHNPKLLEEIKNKLKDCDGLIIFTIGHYGDPEIIKAGIKLIEFRNIPCILANIIYFGDHTFIKIYSLIKDKDYRVYPISSQNFKDFDKYIKILLNILRLRGEEILLLATDSREMNWNKVLKLFNPERKKILQEHPEFINQIGAMRNDDFEFFTDLEGTDQAHPWRVNPREYLITLAETFGVKIIDGEPSQINDYFDKVNKDEAKRIASKWIEDANSVQPSEGTILNSAKMYLALKTLLNDQNVRIFSPDCGTLLLLGRLPAYPCMAFWELSKEGIYGICESDTDSAVSFLLGLYLTGRPGYVSNHTLDLINKQITYMHCVAPYNLEGGKKPFNYDIVYHGESNFLGAAPRVKFPKGETATTIKISVAKRKIALRQGVIIDNVDDPGGCIAKVRIRDDARTILQNYDWETFGWHRVTFLGDWKEHFKVAAKLLGLKLIEEDV